LSIPLEPLEGEVAVVTGAREGIGAAVARGLAEAGARVAVTHHDRAVAEGLAAELGSEHAGFALDVRSTESVDAAAAVVADHLGEPTVLVCSAGINKIGPAESFTDADWSAILDVNLTGLYRCCRAFGGRMLAAGRGCIVNIASIIGPQVGMPGRAPYGASKAGIVGLTRVLGVEWAGRGVRVNALLPGPVRTPMVERAIAQGIVVEDEVVDRTPAGRFATPEDVARAVVLLCSPDAAFVTAQTLVVDGGYTAYGAAHPATRLPGHASGSA
jgi:NAD(P)-dependent dehydrogenase (short-subunit alcohol dehydrogenase family)